MDESLQCSPSAVGASVQSHLKGLLLRGFSYQTASLKVTHHPYFPWGGGVNDWRRKLLPVLYLSFPPASCISAIHTKLRYVCVMGGTVGIYN